MTTVNFQVFQSSFFSFLFGILNFKWYCIYLFCVDKNKWIPTMNNSIKINFWIILKTLCFQFVEICIFIIWFDILRYICKYIKINLFYLCVQIYTKIDNHLHSFNFFNFWFIILNGHNTSTKTMIIMTHLKDEIWICALIKNIKIKCRIHSNCYHLIFLSSHDFEYFGKNWVLKNILQW